jgi:hypothetical protein
MKFVKFWDGGHGWETAAAHTEFSAGAPPNGLKNFSAGRRLERPSGDALTSLSVSLHINRQVYVSPVLLPLKSTMCNIFMQMLAR